MAKYDITYACGHTETVQLYWIETRNDPVEWRISEWKKVARKEQKK